MKMKFAAVLILHFLTAVLAKSVTSDCAPEGSSCKDVKDTWPEKCCDPPKNGTKLYKACMAKTREDWDKEIGSCTYVTTPISRKDYVFMGTRQCSRWDCYYHTDCCSESQCGDNLRCYKGPPLSAWEKIENKLGGKGYDGKSRPGSSGGSGMGFSSKTGRGK